jgi:hypothetical protein
MITFAEMLKGIAQDHFYDRTLEDRPYEEVCEHMRSLFEGPECHRRNLTTWNAITLQEIIDGNPDKSIYQSLQLLIGELCKLQHGISSEFRTPMSLMNKLVMACQGVPAWRIAISDPRDNLSQLIRKLQSSIVAWEKEQPRQGTAFFTDRCYHDRDRIQDRNRSDRRSSERYGSSSRAKAGPLLRLPEGGLPVLETYGR